ncbi:MAG: nuclear transport factor 2 family protein [Phycisphaerales bacterium]|nr:nuclear transport factor 2 family protein [Planctomycetota bacterium]
MSTTATEKKPAFEMPPMSAEHQATEKTGKRMAELIGAGKNLDAIRELYADNVRHVEVAGGPGCDRICEGKATLLEKAEQFHNSIEIHGRTIGKPVVNGDQFILPMSLDCTFKGGPMAGQRWNMQETALYTVKNGKVTEAKFFYSMCG